MSDTALQEFVEATATKFGIPGITVGIWVDGREIFASHGVTSIENPVPVDRDTLFTVGSVSKTFTVTAVMQLVAEGRIDLDAPVRTYVPELTLIDETAAATITVKQLLNHTAGLDWNLINDTGEGDEALAEFVAELAEIPLIGAPGARASYSQAGYNLLGRVIENVTGQSFEHVVRTRVLAPLGLTTTGYLRNEIMTRRFSVGHERGEDGELSIIRSWNGTRANNPGGGISSSVAEQLRWARFHLGDGTTESSETVLPAAWLSLMKQPTVELKASTLGDALGLCWFLRDVDGVRTVGHGGSAFGQFAELLLVPERDFAISVMSNASDGIPSNVAIVRWALEHYLGVIDQDPEPLPFDPSHAHELLGTYDIDAMTMTVLAGDSGLSLECKIKPEIRAAAETELPQDHPPFPFGLLPGEGDEYIITEGSFKGQRGYFSRNDSGKIIGLDLAGRLFTRA
ncbi:serine hydrolase [Nocardia sp. SYP-A9097]|uniref:serine hydrolase domain-containing protein n=1 Tax=Nocardia sp. SYP-A9097 TaxID=2663237 RepID=UPI00129AA449|nr:serine hydrolase domain-containing protein [Nocardia sp. SYP-A9097]MRH89435.1 serine hydrolase [Nocardia sp. SYP-A9097]